MGYLYQCELALLELARRSWDDNTVEVRMELLDDIEFLRHETQDPLELLQSKYREAAGQLSETGKDFWRSVTLDRLSERQRRPISPPATHPATRLDTGCQRGDLPPLPAFRP